MKYILKFKNNCNNKTVFRALSSLYCVLLTCALASFALLGPTSLRTLEYRSMALTHMHIDLQALDTFST